MPLKIIWEIYIYDRYFYSNVTKLHLLQGYFNSGCWVRQVDPRALHEEDELETDVRENKRMKLMLDYSDSSSESEDDCGNTRLNKGGDKRDDDDDEDEGDFSDGTKPTDFVHVSQIDFSLFP